jgi:hypothetical protein
MLGVDTLIIDREERVGDNWRRRYRQLVLHDPIWYDHMPYVSHSVPPKHVWALPGGIFNSNCDRYSGALSRAGTCQGDDGTSFRSPNGLRATLMKIPLASKILADGEC